MTDTPRTDKLIREYNRFEGGRAEHDCQPWVDHARTLERELAAALAAREQDRKDAARFVAYFEMRGDERQPILELTMRELGLSESGLGKPTLDEWRTAIDTAIAAQEAL